MTQLSTHFANGLCRVCTATGISLVSVSTAFAGGPFGPVPNPGGGGDDLSIGQAILKVIDAVLKLLGIIAVAIIIIAGLRLVIGGADEGQREKARNSILYAVIGLIIILLANAIVNFTIGIVE